MSEVGGRDGAGGDRRFPLTDAQAEKWLGSRYSPQAAQAFVESFELVFDGDLNASRLRSALEQVASRHQVLAVRFETDGCTQVYEPEHRLRVAFRDLSGERDPEAIYLGACERDRTLPFDPTVAPLVRACLYRLGPGSHRLFMAAHHLVIDGWSLRILLQEIASFYNATTPEKLARVRSPDSWVDFVRSERALRDGPKGKRSLDYWLSEYTDLPEAMRLPTDRARASRIDFSASSFKIDVDEALWKSLRQAARENSVTRFSCLLACYFALLHRLTGQTDLVCGIPFSGAARGSGARLIGDTDNTLPLRVRVDPEASLQALARHVNDKMRQAADHQDVSLGSIVEALPLQREAGRMLLVESIFTLAPSMGRMVFDGVATRLRPMPRLATAWELVFYWLDGPGGVSLDVQYQSELYDESTVRAWVGLYLSLVGAMAGGDPTAIDDLALSDARQPGAHVLANDTPPELGDVPSVPELLRPAFLAHATRVAAECGDESIDYATLERRSRYVAGALLDHGVGKGDLIGVGVPRSIGMLVAVLAVLRAGAAYVPLDPGFPVQRLQRMADHSGLSRIIADEHSNLPAPLLDGRDRWSLGDLEERGAAVERLPEVGPDDLAYVLYTSGSTGEPKGVRILHRNLVNFLCSMRESPGFSHDDAICAATTLSFDIAALELYLPLLCGGRVVIADEDEHRDPEALRRLIEKRGCTVFQTTPSTMALFQEAGRSGTLAALRLLVGGEALALSLATKLAKQARELWNMYGPTETTVWSSVQKLAPDAAAVSLGQPIARTRLYVLDARGRPALPHALGEIWIGGAGVADGYLHRPDLTAERFVPDPFAADGSCMYRTGDLGRLHDGCLYFHGRVDEQIKLRGYRIEPGDIEAVVAQEVNECVAVVRRLDSGDDALVLYVAGEGPAGELASRLRAKLKRSLPAYMRPQFVEVLECLPKTPNGKIDRRALPEPSREVSTAVGRHAPRTGVEAELCALWQRLLGTEVVGVDDDFFELGGSSLLAVRMFAEMHRRYGVDLPLATLIERPTVAALAEALSAATLPTPGEGGVGVPDRWRSLQRMQVGAGGVPLFLFHAVGGNVLNYLPLLEALGPAQPVYGLQSRGLDGCEAPLDSVPAMADAYAADIASVQPSGPVLLAGGSMGGVIALEVARRLRAQGREVAMLAMFDTHAPGSDYGGPPWRSLAAAHRTMASLGSVDWPDVLRRLRARVFDAPLAALRRVFDPAAPESLAQRLRRIERANHHALADHRQVPYDGDMQLFRAALPPGVRDGTLGWRVWVGGVIGVHELPGNHHDFISGPELGRQLRRHIDLAVGRDR